MGRWLPDGDFPSKSLVKSCKVSSNQMVWLSTLGQTTNPGLAQGKSFRGFDPPGTVVNPL